MNSRNWLDALTDGQIFRDWLALAANFVFGTAWLILLILGFTASLSLSLILIGIPLLLFTLASTRTLAALDYRMMAAILDEDAPPLHDDLDMHGANLGERLGLLLGSSITWRSLVYLLLKFPLGLLSLFMSMFVLPFLAIEVLVLAPLTIDLHLLSVRALHFTATGMHKAMSLLLPKARGKRRGVESYAPPRRLQLDDDDYEDERYILDDDGEISMHRKRS
jgi:hypothetical protein